jgi:hypothetical protein
MRAEQDRPWTLEELRRIQSRLIGQLYTAGLYTRLRLRRSRICSRGMTSERGRPGMLRRRGLQSE